MDGATVDSLVFDALVGDEPELGQGLRVIQRSEPFGIPPVVVHPDLDPTLSATLRQALLNMHADPQGRPALDAVYVDRFVPPDAATYEGVRQMAAEVRGWR